MTAAVVVERDDVPIMFRRVADDQEGISAGMAEVEAAVGLRGRTYFGAIFGGEYWVCVALKEGDDPSAFGLEGGVLPGGRYARTRLAGDPPGVYRRIAPAMRELAQRPDRDTTRPEIEYYRRHDEIDLLMPVR
jgi:DNA gyrase inhibitor GyrI